MGKTKTAFVEPVKEEVKKTSFDELKEKRAKQAEEKIHIAGLKGGQRVKIIEAMPAEASAKAGEPSFAKASKGHREPRVRSKKYNAVKSKVDRNKSYPVKEAITLVKKTSYSKFDGSMELVMVIKKTGLSAQVSLPHSAGRQKRIEIATEKTIEKLKAGKIDFDILVSTPDMMPKLVPFARILGPKGLMPNPKNGTVSDEPEETVRKFQSGQIRFRTENNIPVIHLSVGKTSFDDKKLSENITAVISAVNRERIKKIT